ncbi:MAG: 3-hydroxyacyl-CoA dehydrogenase NAD-binding domain-containing protein [Rhodospirillales bacterium]|jgi:3-hydroxyacyl-CoA dehydrogenase|nr:3-hydroxyacyl-CoA dehydrogenase [Rhodospirillaceae bacterium]MDP6426992.1 3-hydroxyacyl-CoA dehydrogenase NAD-binding domain-containing protein [Rhodospirillales bacterium]MDP6644646.1 3-hydroxyacyl-CoA dehydrogenase NAD-binding domain-containing protein [Rhodospirillales bacterium]MDP6843721.1 3-hydroxyacyl-CoA dehydrogenase NAD-binding domain-containing protein [Rhodospirillales bacterium]
MADLVHLENQGDIAVITIDNPPVNPMSSAVCIGLAERFAEAAADDSVVGIVLTGAGRAFVAGADIREFGKPRPKGAPGLRDVAMQIEDCDKPVVAAINGACAGGGLELALGCHYRLAAPKAQIGLPEVKLGLVPGASGTQRLPRVIGPKAALDVIVKGDLLPAAKAAEMGIIEDVIKDDLVGAAAEFARKAAAEGAPLPRASKRDDKIGEAKDEPGMFDDYRKSIARRARGFEAPYHAIDLVEIATQLPFDEGMEKEREIATITIASDQSKAQRYLFFAEREATKIPDLPADTPVRDIASAAIVGSGTMGGGIAMCFANAGIPVIVIDPDQDALTRGLERVEANYRVSAGRGSMDEQDIEPRMALITGSTKLQDAGDADIVIEAVFEDIELKKEIFAKLDEIMGPDAILATNTSGLDIDAIAAATKRPEAVIGTHFFSPANVMRLLENVRAAKTGNEAIATAMKLGRTLGKQPVLAGLCPGFIGNRILRVYLGQSDKLMFEGAAPDQIDKAIFDFGFAMGPFAVRDLAGLDIGYQARKAKGGSNELRYILNDKLCDAGRFGQKTGAGFYRYEEGSRAPIPDPEVDAMIEEISKDRGIERRQIGDEEIVERIIFPMINEGAQIVDEGIALRASDIDVTYIHGYGFPRYRGGLMFHADAVGLDKVLETMQRLQSEEGEAMAPAPLLVKLAKEGGSFTGG